MGPVVFRKRGFIRAPFFSLVAFWLSIIIVSDGKGQTTVIPGNSRYNDTSGGLIADLPTKIVSSVGEVYWFDKPQVGHICLPNKDSILHHKINIRLDIAGIEIYDGKDIKVLPLGLIHAVSVDSNDFVTHNYFDKRYELTKGFYKILVQRNYSLIVHLSYGVQQQNYNAQFDVGNTRAKAFKEINYLILSSDFRVLDLSESSKKKASKFFTDSQISLRFLKEYKVRFKNEQELVQWVKYENTIPH